MSGVICIRDRVSDGPSLLPFAHASCVIYDESARLVRPPESAYRESTPANKCAELHDTGRNGAMAILYIGAPCVPGCDFPLLQRHRILISMIYGRRLLVAASARWRCAINAPVKIYLEIEATAAPSPKFLRASGPSYARGSPGGMGLLFWNLAESLTLVRDARAHGPRYAISQRRRN